MKRLHRWASCVAGLGFIGCALFTAPEGADGQFHLVKFGDLPVPAQLEQLPPRGDPTRVCWNVLTQGYLGLMAKDGSFGYTLSFVNSCTGAGLGGSGTSGSFRQRGKHLTFRVRLVGLGEDYTFHGTIAGDTVIVRPDSQQELHFVRSPAL